LKPDAQKEENGVFGSLYQKLMPQFRESVEFPFLGMGRIDFSGFRN
jgi:hypothetical protein